MAEAQPAVMRGPSVVEERVSGDGGGGHEVGARRGQKPIDVADSEIHVIGQIIGVSSPELADKGVSVEWEIANLDKDSDELWRPIGQSPVCGHTHTVFRDSEDDLCSISPLCHPLQLSFVSVTGNQCRLPKLVFKAYLHDSLGKRGFLGQGQMTLPFPAGDYQLEVPLWRPVGSYMQQLSSHFVGGNLTTTNKGALMTSRENLKTSGAGTLHISATVMLRNFAFAGVKFNTY